MSAGLAGVKRSIFNSSEGLFDCSQKASIGLMQVELKFRFCIRIGLVDEIAPLAPRGRNRALSSSNSDRDIAPSFQQHPLISVQIFIIHQ